MILLDAKNKSNNLRFHIVVYVQAFVNLSSSYRGSEYEQAVFVC